MTREELDIVTDCIIDNVAQNKDMWYLEWFYDHCTKEEIVDMVDKLMMYVLSLHNLLYESVNGDYYDYMFHWTNKVGVNPYDMNQFDRCFDELIGRGKAKIYEGCDEE
jgi:hypothetical protein